jgi:PST family polysaccharide transporter
LGFCLLVHCFRAFNTIDLWFQSQTQSKLRFLPSDCLHCVNDRQIVLIQMHAPLIAFALARLAEVALAALGLVVGISQAGRAI